MFAKIYKELFIVLAIFIVVWVGFTMLKLEPEAPELQVSIEQEERLAEILLDSYLEIVDEVHNDTVDSAIWVIKERLLSGIETTEYDYTFHVIDESDVNAFATVGGHVFIFTGLIDFTESPEEVAAVLAHEIGHVEHRHVVNKLVKELGLTVLFSILSGGDPVLIHEVSQTAISTVFDRGQETEADEFGLKLMEKTNISPRNLATIFRRIDNEYGGYNKNLEFLMTHPHNNKRIKLSLEYKLPKDFQHEPFQLDWEAVKRNVN